MCSTLLLLQKWQEEVLFYFFEGMVILYLVVIICPNYTCTQLFLVPSCFFVFCCLEEAFVQMQALQPRSRVPACLSWGGKEPQQQGSERRVWRPASGGTPFNCRGTRRCICDDVGKGIPVDSLGVGRGVMGEFFVLFRNPLGSHKHPWNAFEKTL